MRKGKRKKTMLQQQCWEDCRCWKRLQEASQLQTLVFVWVSRLVGECEILLLSAFRCKKSLRVVATEFDVWELEIEVGSRVEVL
jgi:hypothetical protein